MESAHLAIDLGASSGRALVGVLAGEPLTLRIAEVHRFEHAGLDTPSGPVWELTGLWRNILEGLRAAAEWCRANDAALDSVGVDCWGVDWALVGAGGELVGLPHCYRDPQNDAACERVLERLGGFEQLYAKTGTQLMSLNTLFQVAARHEAEPKLFEAAARLLFLPDLFHFWLSGEQVTESTIASTSSMVDVHTGSWAVELLGKLALPTHMLGPVTEAGATIGTIRPSLAEETGAPKNLRVVLPGSHDTASAVAAVPAAEEAVAEQSWAYLSSGTWSLLGAELDRPIVTENAREVPFTNERGIGGSIRFLKNIAGLWLVQELRREFELRGDRLEFPEMVQLAEASEPLRTIVNPNDGRFAAPGDMSPRLKSFAVETNQPEPESVGQLVRCCLESLALCYAETADQLQRVTGKSFDVLHIVGGGSQNELLNQLTAAAIGRPLSVGPVEATAIGNLLVQAMGRGRVSGLADLRQIVARSFEIRRIDPPDAGVDWESVRGRFAQLSS